MEFWNAHEYVLFRDGHKCVHCGKANVPLNVHHLQSRKTGGDAQNNPVTLCERCRREFHTISQKDQKKWELPKRASSCWDATFVGVVRRALYDRLKENYWDVSMTHGYITKNTRIWLELEKPHVNDVYCIAGNSGAKPLKAS